MSTERVALRAGDQVVVDRSGLDAILDALRAGGRRVLGPVVRDGAIVHDELGSVADLPVGWTEDRGPGRSRLEPTDDGALFGFSAPSESWKRHLHPPRVLTVRARRTPDGFRLENPHARVQPMAFVGVRPCDLQAIARLDRVLLGGAVPDPAYAARRAGLFVVAVACGRPGGTCFCASMGTGPEVGGGHDLAMTELPNGDLVVTIGSDEGASVVDGIPHRPAAAADVDAEHELLAAARDAMGRRLEPGAPRLAAAAPEHPRWAEVAERCLACGNCTMVCPTCFCSATEDRTSLDGDLAERERRWASCFELDFSYLHGGPVRASTRSRYRQWLLHKLVTWQDQFGASGCVGCGRCITWCPVGIDLTVEVAALAAPPEGAPSADDP